MNDSIRNFCFFVLIHDFELNTRALNSSNIRIIIRLYILKSLFVNYEINTGKPFDYQKKKGFLCVLLLNILNQFTKSDHSKTWPKNLTESKADII